LKIKKDRQRKKISSWSKAAIRDELVVIRKLRMWNNWFSIRKLRNSATPVGLGFLGVSRTASWHISDSMESARSRQVARSVSRVTTIYDKLRGNSSPAPAETLPMKTSQTLVYPSLCIRYISIHQNQFYCQNTASASHAVFRLKQIFVAQSRFRYTLQQPNGDQLSVSRV